MDKERYEKLKKQTLQFKHIGQEHEDVFHDALVTMLIKKVDNINSFVWKAYKYSRSENLRDYVTYSKYNQHYFECYMSDSYKHTPETLIDVMKASNILEEYVKRNYKTEKKAQSFIELYLRQEDENVIAQKLNTSKQSVRNMSLDVKNDILSKKFLAPYVSIIGLSRRYNLTSE